MFNFFRSVLDRFSMLWKRIRSRFDALKHDLKPEAVHLFLITLITSAIVLIVEILGGLFLFFEGEKNLEKDICDRLINPEDCPQNHLGKLILYVVYTIIKYTSQSTILLMIVIFVYLIIGWLTLKPSEDWPKKAEQFLLPTALVEVLIGSLSASAIPTGLSLIVCAFYDIGLIRYMSGVEIYIAFAGISIVSIAFLATLRQEAHIQQTQQDIGWIKCSEDTRHLLDNDH